MFTIVRFAALAARCLTARASCWIVRRQQRWIQKVCNKRRSCFFSAPVFYCPLSTEDSLRGGRKTMSSSGGRQGPSSRRPHFRVASVRRNQFKYLRTTNRKVFLSFSCIMSNNKRYIVSVCCKDLGSDDNKPSGIRLQLHGPSGIRTLSFSFHSPLRRHIKYSERQLHRKRRKRRARSICLQKCRKYSQAPTVPPRTRSAQHQKLESFIPAFRNQMSSCLGSSLSVQKTSPDFVQQIGSVSVINQNSQLPQLTLLPPSHPKQAVLKKLPPPTVNSSCSSTIQQPPQTLHKPVNSFSHTRPQVTASFTRTTKLAALSNVPKVRSSAQQHSSNISASTVQHSSTSVNDNGISSTLPKVETLHLGSGKSVPLNSLYKSLLNEPYFHPVVRKTLPKLLTKERMFLVRPSTHSQHSLTLSVQERGKIFNISVRERSDGKYALGTEKIGEMTFSTVDEIIEHHRREPIRLEDGSSTYLKWTPQKENTYVRR